jgi:fumarate reductase flavoprotein subunit
MSVKAKRTYLKADLVIIGSGGGLAAAVASAEAGVGNIILLEKQAVLGGNTRLAGGFFACESPVQKRANIVTSKDEYFKIAMKWDHWNRVNPGVMRAFINKSGDTVRWLEEKGVEFEPKKADSPGPRGGHSPVGRGIKLQQSLADQAKKLGVKILLKTAGKKIIRSKNGRITGVLAEQEGQPIEIKTGCVIIATGGFSGNAGLLKKLCPDFHDEMLTGTWPHHTGDGLLMAREIGGALAESVPIFHNGPVPETGPWGGLANVIRYPSLVWVNKKGKRFVDETGYHVWETGNAILHQPDRIMYGLFDDITREKMEEEGLLTAFGWGSLKEGGDQYSAADSRMKAQVDKGLVKKSKDWSDLAGWIGADPAVLKKTLEEYNTGCDKGYDPLYARENNTLIALRKPPFYAVKGYVHLGETMGGIKITERMEVVDNQDNVIPGLYAAGVIADGWSGQTYCSDEIGGSAFSFAVNSGRMAGESAAQFVAGEG